MKQNNLNGPSSAVDTAEWSEVVTMRLTLKVDNKWKYGGFSGLGRKLKWGKLESLG